MPRSGAVNDDTMQFEEFFEAGSRDEQPTAEAQRWNLASAHALVSAGARDAEQLGDLGDGVGELVQVILRCVLWHRGNARATDETRHETIASRNPLRLLLSP